MVTDTSIEDILHVACVGIEPVTSDVLGPGFALNWVKQINEVKIREETNPGNDKSNQSIL